MNDQTKRFAEAIVEASIGVQAYNHYECPFCEGMDDDPLRPDNTDYITGHCPECIVHEARQFLESIKP